MSTYFEKLDGIAGRLSGGVLRLRWLVIVASILAAVAIGSGGASLEFDNNYRAFFSKQNPELQAFEQLQATYTKNDNFLFVIEPADKDVFHAANLSVIEKMTEAAWQIPYALRVDSVTNFQHSYGVDDDLIVEDMIADAASLDPAMLAERRQAALDEPLLNGLLINADASVTAINVVLQYPEKSIAEVPEAVAAARALREQIEVQYPGTNVSLTGVSMLNNAFAETGMTELGSLVPIMFGVIVLLSLLILRSVSATVATTVVIVLSTMVAMGAAGLFGVKLTPISGSAPIVILTLAIADSIHILISLRSAMLGGMQREEAIREAVRLNFIPVSITSLTTIIGFTALNFSDSPPFWHLGNITAIGIAAAWVFSLTLLPALMRVLPYRVKPSAGKVESVWMNRLADFVVAQRRKLLPLSVLAVLLLVAAIPQLALNDGWTEYFDERVEFRRDTDQAVKHFGVYPIEFSVEAAAAGGINDPQYLANLDKFAVYLRAQPEVTHVYSLADVMKRLNRNLHGDDPSWYRLPAERDLSAQYLLLYELSLPYGLDLNDRVNIDKSASRITATLSKVDTVQTRAFLDNTREWLAQNMPSDVTAKPTGAQVMFTYIASRNVSNMISGTILALSAIAILLMLALRSVRLGLLSLLPNAMPILATFGVWALLIGEVGFSVATVASVSLGIIVDDTVHFLAKYIRARRERAMNAEQAIRYAFTSVGKAIVVNTVILVAGFLVLTTSSFKVNVDMGMLTAIAIVFALVLDFLFLPPLLMWLDGDRQPKVDGKLNPKLAAGTASALLVSVMAMTSMATPAHAAELTPVRGETEAQRKGFEIAARSDRSDRGFADSEVELTMLLRNAAGQESSRSLRISTLEVEDESVGDLSLVLFDTPRDIEGTALLSHAQILTPDDQWLYLPALKRVKRISSANKSGPFVGSEFAFEDFTATELNKFDYEWTGEAPCGELVCDVITRFPRYENSGYTKQIVKIDQTDFQVRELAFYDRRDDLLKTLSFADYRNHDGVWRAYELAMVNHQTGKSTDMVYQDYRFGVGLGKNDFVKGRLSRLR